MSVMELNQETNTSTLVHGYAVAGGDLKDHIQYFEYLCDAFDFDYSWLGIDDLIFISVDVEHKRIFSKIIETSKAQLHVCAPYDNTWLYNLLKAKGSI